MRVSEIYLFQMQEILAALPVDSRLPSMYADEVVMLVGWLFAITGVAGIMVRKLVLVQAQSSPKLFLEYTR